jgi:hypothetical protein
MTPATLKPQTPDLYQLSTMASLSAQGSNKYATQHASSPALERLALRLAANHRAAARLLRRMPNHPDAEQHPH